MEYAEVKVHAVIHQPAKVRQDISSCNKSINLAKSSQAVMNWGIPRLQRSSVNKAPLLGASRHPAVA
jgi:hypothetical protein